MERRRKHDAQKRKFISILTIQSRIEFVVVIVVQKQDQQLIEISHNVVLYWIANTLLSYV